MGLLFSKHMCMTDDDSEENPLLNQEVPSEVEQPIVHHTQEYYQGLYNSIVNNFAAFTTTPIANTTYHVPVITMPIPALDLFSALQLQNSQGIENNEEGIENNEKDVVTDRKRSASP